MPRKQRFKPTRKPKLTTEGAVERTDEHPHLPTADDRVMSRRAEEQENERRSE